MQKAVPIQPNTVSGARQPTPALQSTASLAQPNTPNVTANNIAEVFANASTAFSRFGEVCRALKAQPSEGSNSGSDPTEAQRWREDCIELLRAATSRFATDLCAIAEAQRTRQLATLKEEFQRKSYAEVGLVYPDDAAYTNEADEYGVAMNDGTAYEAGYGDAVYAEGVEYANAVYAEADGAANAAQSAAGVETDSGDQKAVVESEMTSVNDSALVQAANESEAAYLDASASAPATNGASHTQSTTEYSNAPVQATTSESLNVSASESQSETLAAHFVGDIEIEKL